MSITVLTLIGKSKVFPVDKSKIEKRELTPQNLELSLMKGGGTKIYISLVFDEKKFPGSTYILRRKVQTNIPLGHITDEEAIKKYEEVSEKIKKGEYSLIQYDDGTLEIKWN